MIGGNLSQRWMLMDLMLLCVDNMLAADIVDIPVTIADRLVNIPSLLLLTSSCMFCDA